MNPIEDINSDPQGSSNLTFKWRCRAKAEARVVVSYESSKGHNTPDLFIMTLRIGKDKIDVGSPGCWTSM
jgi:hypothetical protein